MIDGNERALVTRKRKSPWIPDNNQWQAFLAALREEPPRNQVMVLLAYEGALRSHELLSLKIGDIDIALHEIALRPETTRRLRGRTIYYPEYLHTMLIEYVDQRRRVSGEDGALFVTELRDISEQSLPYYMWTTIVKRIARRAGTPLFKTGTIRYLRLAEMVRDGVGGEIIAAYAGYRVQLSIHILHPITLEIIRREILHKSGPHKAQ